MSERFFSSEPIVDEHVTLDGSEAHHLMHVMRAAAGDSVTLFDGSGAEFTATIEKRGRSEVELRIVARHEVNRELPFKLSVGVALPKGDRQKWLVEKLTELGVTSLIPLETQRGVAQPNAAALDRLARSVIEAAKQCGRNRLMEIAKPQTWPEWVLSGEASEIERRLVAHPHGKALSQVDVAARLNTRLAIGPEGGFTDSEIEAAACNGWALVDLGPRILRVETAAVALSAAVALLNPPLAPP
ncbi:MAG TPA: 16S rRNA (uracil(1498)-N(3))-methyltransferase [Lacipirellulaceae bacterium]|nr:16S rRNA (uracil(1498)-N(3))-methyltransferase [Lacipirellulaceae bacterium]